MAVYIVQPPAGITETDAGRIQKYLENQGFVITSVEVLQTNTGVLTYKIESTTDPTSLITSYVKSPNQIEQARTILSELQPKLIDGTATTVEMRRALAALVVLQNV
jgi:hypothetical protein